MKRIAFLGPAGTYTEEAASSMLHDAQLIPYSGIAQVLMAVEKGEVDGGVVPIENSLEGSVSLTLDLLAQMELKIQRELSIPISHNLLVRQGIKLEEIEIIYSHPQALAQCRNFIQSNLPKARIEVTASTAEAACKVADTTANIGAIAGVGAAKSYDLEILAKDIQDSYVNETRFILVGSEEVTGMAGKSRTSLFVTISERPGGLYQILREFALRGISLSKIESRPVKNQSGDYLFFIEFIGHYQDPLAAAALEAIAAMTVTCKLLGAYPVGKFSTGEEKEITENIALEESKMSLKLVREEIDIIDLQIVELLAQRTALVRRVGEIKGDIGKEVKDTNREALILDRIKKLAGEKGFSPEVIEGVYKTLFNYFVNLQKKSI